MKRNLNKLFNKLFHENRGATILEYGLVVFLVALAGVAALDVIGDTLNDLMNLIEQKIDQK